MSPRRIAVRLLFWGGGALLIVLLWPCILLFLISYGAAAAMEPLVGRLVRWRVPRPLASGVVLSMLVVLLGLALWLTASRVFYELGQFLLQLPALLAQVQESWLEKKLYAFLVAAPEELRDTLTAAIGRWTANGLNLPDRLSDALTAWMGKLVAALPGLLLALTTSVLAIFFCSADLPHIRTYLRELIPDEYRGKVARFGGCLRRAGLDWCRVQGRLMGIVFGILAVGLLLLRVPYAFLAAGLGALIDALPFFGSGILLVPWSVFSLLQGEAVRAVGLLVLYGLLCLTRSLLEPRLYGKQAGVSPLLTLLALYGGFRLFGVWGMLLAPIALSIGGTVVQERNASMPESQSDREAR